MKKQPWCSFSIAGVSLTEFGAEIPSPFTSLTLTNSEITSFTSWELNVIVGGNANKKMNITAFEALLYSAAQSAYSYSNASGVPVSFMFGWIDQQGKIQNYLSYQGFTLKFEVSTSDMFLRYKITGYASMSVMSAMPVLNIPAVRGIVQPSAILEGLATAVKATNYYTLDIDHNDEPTYVNHGAMTTSLTSYVRGNRTGDKDNFDDFPGLLTLSKSYNSTRDAGGIKHPYNKLSTLVNNLTISPLRSFLKKSLTDNTVQSNSFTFWVDEPTMTQPGVIHYKSTAGLSNLRVGATLEYGTANTNVISISGSYNGVAYNMTNMNFGSLGFTVDGSGQTIVSDYTVTNSWSSSLADVFQSASIMNDVNALASQFSGSFDIQIPGSTNTYSVAQPVSLIVMSGNTLSQVSGIYNIMSVTHNIGSTYTTTLKLQRLTMGSATQTGVAQNLVQSGTNVSSSKLPNTSNIISANKVSFGTIYPTYEHISSNFMYTMR